MKNSKVFKLNRDIFNSDILDLLNDNFKKDKWKEYYLYEYDLIIKINNSDIIPDNLNKFVYTYWRPWYKNYDFIQKIELVLRIITSQITNCLQNNLVNIRKILVKNDTTVQHVEIKLVKVNNDKKSDEVKKFFLDIHLLANVSICKILDLIRYDEHGFCIDERNNNKTFYNSLLLKKENGQKIDIHSLNSNEWKQLILKEKVTSKNLATLYDMEERNIVKIKKEFISNIKHYTDEYIFYYVMIYDMSVKDYYSNFCIPILEQLKSQKIEIIYEYLNLNYHEILCVKEELKYQKEIEKDNLAGKKYVMPLSGVLLKKLYWTIKNKQLDRKFFKNNWFNTYYGPMFLKNFLENIEKSHILDLYENGTIYKHPNFKLYQVLYEELNLKESDDLNDKVLTRVLDIKSKNREKVKKLKKVLPRDYVSLIKSKNDVGRTGEELVYDYLMNVLKEYPELQNKTEKIYLENEAAGYDIKSYDLSGNEIYIEVKTNKADCNNRIKFYISRNEDEFISKHKNAYIYYVYDLKKPKLRIIDQKTYLSYYKKPTHFEIDQKII